MIWRVSGLIVALAAAPAAAKDPLFGQPIACMLGKGCFIQNYVDHDPGKGVADFTCGALSYDGHKGTDFALPTLDAMNKGVDVVAAAPGKVAAIRDGMSDQAITNGTSDITGRECGNGVLVDHGGGWQTQYCHMRNGSVAVRNGQRVAKGTVLGEVGLSGNTQFPHLHFAVRHNDTVVDPFDPDGIVDCAPTDRPLWQTAPPYDPGRILGAGIAGKMPTYDDALAGLSDSGWINQDTKVLAVWVHAFGGRTSDRIRLALAGPNGIQIAQHTTELEKNQARFFRVVGARAPRPDGWPAGTYVGTLQMIRGGTVLSSRTVSVELGP